MPIRYDAIWEFGFLEELVGRNNVILQANFDALLQDGEVRENSAHLDAVVPVSRERRAIDTVSHVLSCSAFVLHVSFVIFRSHVFFFWF